MKTQKSKNVLAPEADLPCAIDISSHSHLQERKRDLPDAMIAEKKEVPIEVPKEVLKELPKEAKEVAIEVVKEVAILAVTETKVGELTATKDLTIEETAEETMTDILAAISRTNTITTIDTVVGKSIREPIVSHQLLVTVAAIENKMILDVAKIELPELKIEPQEPTE
jgi:hypothetical protein